MDKEALKHEFNYQDLVCTEDLEKIKNFKYNGKDDSYLYDKCLSPLAAWIVENKLPTTLA